MNLATLSFMGVPLGMHPVEHAGAFEAAKKALIRVFSGAGGIGSATSSLRKIFSHAARS